MTKQVINVGTSENSQDGDNLRDAFIKVNNNFTELYSTSGAGAQIPAQTGNAGKFLTTDGTSTSWSVVDSIGDDVQFVSVNTSTGLVVVQSGYNTGMPVYIKGGNCDADGFGGNVVIEAGAPDGTGTIGDIELSANQTTIESLGNVWTFQSGDGSQPGMIFPEWEGEQLAIQGTEITAIEGLAVLGSVNGDVVLSTGLSGSRKDWMFGRTGDLTLPSRFPISFTAVLDEAHYTGGVTEFTGDGTFQITFELQGDGTTFLWAGDSNVYDGLHGYQGGEEFLFGEEDHGIPGYVFGLLLQNVVETSPGSFQAGVALGQPPSILELAKVKSVDELIFRAGNKAWVLGVDGNLILPQGGDIVDSDGNTVLGSNGISINNFGDGFGLDNADKIVTRKLYSTNETNSAQHYRLELDTNGVVHLPDQSIINGATLKSVAGNYAGITAGPVGKDEDSWMWVDTDGAWIATDYSTNAYTWKFDNTGVLTLPVGGNIVDSDGNTVLGGGGGTSYNQSLNTTDNVTFNKLKIANNLHAPAAGGAYDKIKLYDFADVAKVNYAIGTEDHHIWMSVDDVTAGFKWYGGTNLALTLLGNGTITVPGGAQIIPKIQGGNSIDIKAGAGTDAWAELISNNERNFVWVDNNGSYIGSNLTYIWTFGTDGYLQLPGVGEGIKSHGLTERIRFNSGNVKIDTNSGANSWTFGQDATLTLPDTTSQVFTTSNGMTLSSPNKRIRLLAQNTTSSGSAQVYVKSATSTVEITTDVDGSHAKTWTFGNDGSLTFPANGTITAASGNLAFDAPNYVTINSTNGDGQIEIGRYQTGGNVILGGTNTPVFVEGDLTIAGTINSTLVPTVGLKLEGLRLYNGSGTNTYIWTSASEDANITTLNAYNGGDLTGFTVEVWHNGSVYSTATITSMNPLGFWSFSTDANLGFSDLSDTLTFISPDYALSAYAPINVNVGTNAWTFENDGRLALGESTGYIYANQTTGEITIADYLGAGGIPPMPSTSIQIGGEDNAFVISRGNGSNNPSWYFEDGGILTLPNNNYIETSNINMTAGSQGDVRIMSDAAGSGQQYTWTFSSTGNLTLPQSLGSGNSDIYKNSEYVDGVSADIRLAWDLYQQAEAGWVASYTEESGVVDITTRPWYGVPSYAVLQILTDNWNAQQAGEGFSTPAISGAFYNQIRAAAIVADANYTLWQGLVSTIEIKSANKTWAFGSDGVLMLPTGGDIVDGNTVSVFAREPKFEIVGNIPYLFAVANKRYGVNTTTGSLAVFLPRPVNTGDTVFIVDSHGTFSTHNLTIDGNGNTIAGNATVTISTDNENVGLFYNGTEWRYYA